LAAANRPATVEPVLEIPGKLRRHELGSADVYWEGFPGMAGCAAWL